MKRLPAWAAILLVFASTCCACARPAALPQASPEEAGLVWRECTATDLAPAQADACFGPRPALGNADKARLGVRTGSGLSLSIGDDRYEARDLGVILGPYVLLKNRRPVRILLGEFLVYDPNISLQSIAGKAAWEFADPRQATVIYDGRDLRAVYGLEAAYAPYELGGKLAFIGKKDGRYALVYDGRQVGPAFDRMDIAYCCEAVLCAPHGAGDRYRFWGWRGETLYTVEVAPAPVAPLPRAFKGWELYSWPADGDWRFTLILGTNRNKTCEEITAGGRRESAEGLVNITVTGVEAIKRTLARLPQGEHVYWLGEARLAHMGECSAAFALPDRAVVDELIAHCRALGVELWGP